MSKPVNIDATIAGLLDERKRIEETVVALLRLKEARGTRQGRPSKAISDAKMIVSWGKYKDPIEFAGLGKRVREGPKGG